MKKELKDFLKALAEIERLKRRQELDENEGNK